MSDEGGSGAPENGGQQGTQNGTTDTGGANGSAGTGTATAPKDTGASTDDWSATEWKALADELGLKPSEVKEKLGHARTWEDRAKANKDAAKQLPSLQEQVERLRQEMTERDVRDTERSGRLAMSQLRSGLKDAGIEPDDIKDVLGELDPTRFLKDGEPNDEAINRFVGGMAKAAGRSTADHDQGQKSGAAPQSMGAVMREMAQKNRR